MDHPRKNKVDKAEGNPVEKRKNADQAYKKKDAAITILGARNLHLHTGKIDARADKAMQM